MGSTVADYYSLIARAITGINNSTDATRIALYERARSALRKQLRRADPPFAELNIVGEQLALEQAIREVEMALAKRSLTESSAGQWPHDDPCVGGLLENRLSRRTRTLSWFRSPHSGRLDTKQLGLQLYRGRRAPKPNILIMLRWRALTGQSL